MLVMAIEAAKQMSQTRTDLEITGYSFKDIAFLKTLPLTTDFDGVEVEFHLRPLQKSSDRELSWEEFHLYLCENEEWAEICRGCIRVEYKEEATEVDQGRESSEQLQLCQQLLIDRKASCDIQVDIQQAYEAFNSAGLGFGPAFQSLQNGAFNRGGEAVANLFLHSWRSEGGERYHRPYVIHPTTLDGILQLPFFVLSEGGQKSMPSFVPTHIKKLWISNSGLSDPGQTTVRISNKCAFRGFREAESSAIVLDSSESQILISMEGYEMTAVGSAGPGSEDTKRTQCFNFDSRPDVDLLDQKSFDEYIQSTMTLKVMPIETHRQRELVMNLAILIALEELATIDKTTLASHHQKYIRWMEHKRDQLGTEQLQELSIKLQDRDSVDILFDKLRDGSPTGKFLVEIGRKITGILCDKVDALDLFFRTSLVKDYYVETNATTNINMLQVWVDALAHKRPGLRILEIGAGTGGLTRTILNSLTNYGEHESHVPRFAHYTYTDISPSFFANAQGLFEGLEDKVTFKTLDIEKNPTQQGFEAGAYDLIIADNVGCCYVLGVLILIFDR